MFVVDDVVVDRSDHIWDHGSCFRNHRRRCDVSSTEVDFPPNVLVDDDVELLRLEFECLNLVSRCRGRRCEWIIL